MDYQIDMKKVACFLTVFILFCLFPLQPWAADQDEGFRKAIVRAKLQPPDAPDARAYLSLKQKSGTVMLSDIKADIIIVEIFSMYCPFCQKHAPETNKLHKAILANPATKGKVKLIGIGVGNSPYEVNFFKKKYGIEFPLFPDGNSAVMNSIVGIKTPYYFGIRKSGKALTVFFSQQGAFEDSQAFLKTVLEKAGQS